MIDLSTSLAEALAIRADLARALDKCRGVKPSEIEEALALVRVEIEGTEGRVSLIFDALEQTIGLYPLNDFTVQVGNAVYAAHKLIGRAEWDDTIGVDDIAGTLKHADQQAQELIERLAKIDTHYATLKSRADELHADAPAEQE
jgi:hypothetical protein